MADGKPCGWSEVARREATLAPPKDQLVIPKDLRGASFKSSEGISVVVVDSSSLIDGGERVMRSAEKLVSVKEVLDEIKDPVSRHRMAFMPFTIHTMEPSEESLKQIISFARATGDLRSLSDVDIKLLALTYTLEAEVHGTAHLRTRPPPLHVLRVRRLPEKDLPGWGSNVPNLDEWEDLERTTNGNQITQSRILGLKNLKLDSPEASGVSVDEHTKASVAQEVELPHVANNQSKLSIAGQVEAGVNQINKPRKEKPQKREVKIDGKLMVSEGIDASKGESKENMEDWQPAVSRSTRRRYIRRQARKALSQQSLEYATGADANLEAEISADVPNEISQLETGIPKENTNASIEKEARHENKLSGENNSSKTGLHGSLVSSNDTYSINRVANLNIKEGENSESLQEHHIADTLCVDEMHNLLDEGSLEDESIELEVDDMEHNEEEVCGVSQVECLNSDSGHLASHQEDSASEQSHQEDSASEQSWSLRSFSNSTIACATNDFAMQNVILQMGLRLLSPNGIQVNQLHRWVLKCHACNGVTADVSRMFCPKCGNGGTLRKISVTVGGNGVVQAGRQPRIRIRGTRYSIPLPKGGREAITKNPILREDQLAHKILYPKDKKKSANYGLDMLSSGEISFEVKEKRAPLQAPIRQTVAVFSGRRNPNDNHFSRHKH
ncbi:hypothetical protein SUGI_0734430 [Cryptomeria japonica]|uniref:RNA-binding NOB1-like protein n=1 Tax=Cryptomeria japonica TaxID=3369 RepID=UPI002414A928|nr:RNA-binding NOB1-like protein [Cryptomeria japonica]GLJ36547.1 hypothetical protein SUGI_0734430 [Cryptomeria japonica]